MKALKIIGIVLVAIIALVVIVGLVAPKDFHSHRDIVINASEETVWHSISTYEAFNKWNPWSKLDPKMEIKEEGTGGNVGDKHYWKGSKDVGEGTMTVTKVEPGKSVEYDLHFADWDAHNIGYLNMEKAEGGYKVTWGFKGTMPFPWNVMGLFMGGTINKDFDEGLANMKKLCESAPVAAAYEVKEVDWTEKNCLSIRKEVAFTDFDTFFGDSYAKLGEVIGKGGGTPGVPLGVYYKFDEKGGKADVAAAIPYEGGKVSSKEYAALNLPASKAYSIEYFGAYDKAMAGVMPAMNAKLKELGADHPDLVIEEYIANPGTEKDTAKWHTIYYFTVTAPAKAMAQ